MLHARLGKSPRQDERKKRIGKERARVCDCALLWTCEMPAGSRMAVACHPQIDITKPTQEVCHGY